MMGRMAWLWLLFVVLVALPAHASGVRDAAHAITELDLERAQKLLAQVQTDSQAASFERARLAMYRGDCDTADAILSAPNLASTPDGARLAAVAQGCARATAAAVEFDDEARGVWIRFQDSRDRVLAPFIVEVAAASRRYLEHELQVDLPRPLRIELVRDLFSLSAVTGLPVEAAETTGTVGVARFGRVVLVSPRATPRGYPWEDTLAHEIVHLFVTRATRDYAPLWLQEGIAKLHETGWRPARPFDDPLGYERVAREAQRSGNSVGLGGLGQSIALLPTPEMAATAYAEVTSFMRYWIDQEGRPALRLLLADLRGVGSKDADDAMRTVSGYDLAAWDALWKRHLSQTSPPQPPVTPHRALLVSDVLGVKDVVRRVRLGDLLASRGHYEAASQILEPALAAAPREASIRWRAARARLALDDSTGALERLGTLKDIERAHGGWFALWSRLKQDSAARQQSVALDPLSEDVACQGWFRPIKPDSAVPGPARVPQSPKWRELCLGAREIPRD